MALDCILFSINYIIDYFHFFLDDDFELSVNYLCCFKVDEWRKIQI